MMTKRTLAAIFAAIFAAIVAGTIVTGCTASEQQQARKQANDGVIVAEVRAKIATVDPATLAEVRVKVSAGVVTLTGETRSAKERDDIDAAARSINGVRSVKDRIAINPRARTAQEIASDVTLETKIEAALAAQTGVNALRLKVHAVRGVVTIEGKLRTHALHDTAIETAKSVAGVKRIVDRIRIQR